MAARNVHFPPDPLQQTTDNTQHRDVLLILKGPSLQCVFGSKTSRHPRDFKAFFHNKNTQSVPVNLTISFIQTGKNSVCVCVISLYMYLCTSRCIKMDKVNVQKTYLRVIQRLVLTVTPPPQVRLHSPYGPHESQ